MQAVSFFLKAVSFLLPAVSPLFCSLILEHDKALIDVILDKLYLIRLTVQVRDPELETGQDFGLYDITVNGLDLFIEAPTIKAVETSLGFAVVKDVILFDAGVFILFLLFRNLGANLSF